MTTSATANLPDGTDNPEIPALIRTRCGDADGLLIEAIAATVPAVPDHVSFEYSCLSCGSCYGHDAAFQQAAELLNAGATAPGVLHFGHHFIHCGEPMDDIREDISRLDPPADAQSVPPAATWLRTRLPNPPPQMPLRVSAGRASVNHPRSASASTTTPQTFVP